ncbi:protein FAM124A isoform X2 [Falco biarmicus]|uniref:protein FAM124A isoform X2 n=1 Tax=Falco peregrinus TaxID=8954 RepID=UPI000FFCAA79|nr:protein FAM124A isoform X2 [Falco peregrinus]XP_056185637.1 protein FAM124A isoform X2 [Falco biarmicus]
MGPSLGGNPATSREKESEYSRMSSTSSELSVEGIQDPFLVSVHIITDPGESKTLQQAIDKLLAWIHPDLQLFRVSERRVPKERRKPSKAGVSQPALAIILFLQEEYGEEPILQLHETFQRPPWHYHHTERVHGKFLPYMPCSQDFYTLAPETPLWAIRPVHYGKEIIRFTIYCRSENFVDILKLYELILKRPVCQKKVDFCVFPVYSNMEIDIQFSLKKLPKGQVPMPTESAVLEFRVKDVGQLVPLLPNPCSPISEGRWQTEDHDGNRILLQQARSWCRKSAKQNKQPYPSVSTYSRSTTLPAFLPQSHRSVPEQPKEMDQNKVHQANGLGHYLGFSQQDLRHNDRGDFTRRSSSASSISRSFQRSKSLFCLPTVNCSSASETSHFSEPSQFFNTGSPATRLKTWRCSPRLNIDDLEGAQETDVDTGMKLSFSDLSVVSAYSALNGFCSDLEASLPPQKQTVGKAKQAATGARPVPAMCNTFESVDGSLPSLSEWSSSSFTSASLSKQHKQSSRAAPCSLDDHGSVCPALPVNEEEFYI